jgi:hypothetical protein
LLNNRTCFCPFLAMMRTYLAALMTVSIDRPEITMILRRKLYLMTSSLAIFGMVTAPMPGFAQPAIPAAPYPQQAAGGDPPALVGRLATLEGTVSTHAQGEDHWSPAVINAPITNGDAYWTEPQALAEVEVSSSSLWMNGSTEFDVTTLDDAALHAATPQGEVYVHLRSLEPNETYTIETPRGTVTMAADGRYDIVAGDTTHPTTVSVLDGAAQITGNNISLQIHANQTASVTGDTTFEGSVGPLSQDDFVGAMLQREHPVAPSGVAPPPVVAQMTGSQDLNQYGSWDNTPDYGAVWYPQVDSGWAPYREGRWSYVAPWGWTWVDAAPWGFAPFHYGRWVQIGPRWGWAPVYPGFGGGYRPVYAPALVSFFGIGVGVAVGVGIGFGLGAAYGPGANIGWVPLGAREAYYPPYRVSPAYVNRVNVTNITNVTNIYNGAGARGHMPVSGFANARAATVVPASAMADSRPVNAAYRRPSAAELSGAHPLVDRAPISPTARTVGLTPAVAQQMHVSGFQQRRAPGPAVQAEAGPGRQERPMLRPGTGTPSAMQAGRPEAGRPEAGQPEAGRPEAGRPEARPAVGAPGPRIGGEARPGGLPALREPGARPESLPRPEAAQGREVGSRPEVRSSGVRPEQHTGAQPNRAALEPRAASQPRAEAPAFRQPREAAPVTRRQAEPARAREAAPAERASPRVEPRAAPERAQPRAEPRREEPMRAAPRPAASRPAPRPPEKRPDEKPH